MNLGENARAAEAQEKMRLRQEVEREIVSMVNAVPAAAPSTAPSTIRTPRQKAMPKNRSATAWKPRQPDHPPPAWTPAWKNPRPGQPVTTGGTTKAPMKARQNLPICRPKSVTLQRPPRPSSNPGGSWRSQPMAGSRQVATPMQQQRGSSCEEVITNQWNPPANCISTDATSAPASGVRRAGHVSVEPILRAALIMAGQALEELQTR